MTELADNQKEFTIQFKKGMIKPIKKPEVVKINRRKNALCHSQFNSTLDNYKRSDNLAEGMQLKQASLNPKQGLNSISDKLSY
jgi:hypothetical protein